MPASIKIASARVLLALALIAGLASNGCGGGSPDHAGTASSSSAAEGVSEATGPTGKSDGSPASGEAVQEKGAGAGEVHGKRGKSVAVPKGPPEPELTAKQRAQATVADIVLEGPALSSTAGGPGTLAATYTCEGADRWPSLRWRAVPSGTAELALFAMNVQPVDGKIFFDWAVAGLDPGRDEIVSGRLPPGAVLGRNGFGKAAYSICPSGAGETYLFALYALPKALDPKRGFDPRSLRKRALAISGNVGLLAATYSR